MRVRVPLANSSISEVVDISDDKSEDTFFQNQVELFVQNNPDRRYVMTLTEQAFYDIFIAGLKAVKAFEHDNLKDYDDVWVRVPEIEKIGKAHVLLAPFNLSELPPSSEVIANALK